MYLNFGEETPRTFSLTQYTLCELCGTLFLYVTWHRCCSVNTASYRYPELLLFDTVSNHYKVIGR